MRKKSDRRKLQDKLWELTKEAVRRRDGNTCQKCGKTVTRTNRHNSHVIPKSRDKRLEFDPLNVKILCHHCHMQWWHLFPTESGEWFKKKFPERHKYLTQQHQNNLKLGNVKTSWFEDRIMELKEELSVE